MRTSCVPFLCVSRTMLALDSILSLCLSPSSTLSLSCSLFPILSHSLDAWASSQRSPALRSWLPDYGNRREEEKKDMGDGRRSISVFEEPVAGFRPTGRDACLALRIHIACQECASRRMEVNYEILYYSPFRYRGAWAAVGVQQM